jgi:hypothetical protein
MHDMLRQWAGWISNTELSKLFQDVTWVVPISQSIHIIGVCVVFGCALMISLRLLGLRPSGRSVSQLVTTLVPWMYRALVVLLITGVVQTITEPMRQFVTPEFWWKMFMILCVVTLTVWSARTVRTNAARWDAEGLRPASARVFALVSIALWVGIIYCGRFIGYTWSLYV